MPHIYLFRLIEADEWQALYVNGGLMEQNHHIDLIALLKEVTESLDVRISFERYFYQEDPHEEGDYLWNCGEFPDNFDYIPPHVLYRDPDL